MRGERGERREAEGGGMNRYGWVWVEEGRGGEGEKERGLHISAASEGRKGEGRGV